MAPVGLRPHYDVTTSCSACTESLSGPGGGGSGSFSTMPFMGQQETTVVRGVADNVSGATGNDSLATGSGSGMGSHDDATWILTSAFIVFTMQSGFGLLESGSVSTKNEVSIMVKNAVDVIFGGLSYWMFGFGLSFGEQPLSNPFCGWGDFFVSDNARDFGWVYSKFFFQASFATTATTIVSGAMAERTKLESYIIFSFVNTFVFCIPAHWVWANNGWLAQMGVIDIAGAGPVHLVGGATGLVATLMLKPRHNRFKTTALPPMGSPSNAILGMFMLWWGWLGFNCGSTFGISGLKWKLAARSAVATICASFAGGMIGLGISYFTKRKQFDVPSLINGVLSALVSVTGLCALAEPWEAIIVGGIGALLCLASIHLLDKLHIDDPVGCVGVHAVGGVWSLVAGGLFTPRDVISMSIINKNVVNYGLFKGGGGYLLGIQALACVSITIWTIITSFILLKAIELIVGLRVSPEHEALGADLVEHGVGTGECSYDKLTSQVTWHKVPTKMGHTCDACDFLQHHVPHIGCSVEERPQGAPAEPEGLEPASLLRHVERRRSKNNIFTFGGSQTERERIQAYGTRASCRSSRTLGSKLGKKTFASMRFSVGKKIRGSTFKKSQSTNSTTRVEQHDIASEPTTNTMLENNGDGFVLSNITIDGVCN